jgi:hypothetical protein
MYTFPQLFPGIIQLFPGIIQIPHKIIQPKNVRNVRVKK